MRMGSEPDILIDRRGNRALIGITCMNMVLYILTKAYYVHINGKRDKIWNAMSLEVSSPTFFRVSSALSEAMLIVQ